MGNKVFCHARVILTEDIALNVKSSNLVRDVVPIVCKWRADGAELSFDLREFQITFDVVKGVEHQFSVFDTDANGRVDAHEVMMVYILLSSGDLGKKIETVFETFEFQAHDGDVGSINFDEAMIMLESCVRGVQKVCTVDFHIAEDEVYFHCKSLFDKYKTNHDGRITRKEFCDWCQEDPSPKAFLSLFQLAQGLPDINAMVQQVNLRQSQVFQMEAQGQLFITPQELMGSEEFRRQLRKSSDWEVDTLVRLMTDESGRIGSDRFHSVLRPWNIFDACDLNGDGDLDSKEMEILLWVHMRVKPTQEFVREFVQAIDGDNSGTVDRIEWVNAIVKSHGGIEEAAFKASERTKTMNTSRRSLPASMHRHSAVEVLLAKEGHLVALDGQLVH